MEVDKTPVGAETGPDVVDFFPEATRRLDSLRHMRLLALLHDMIDAGDGATTAAALGVSYRTVSRAVRSGTLTDRMASALERHLLLGGGSAAAQQREQVENLEKRVAELERDLGGRLDAAVREVKSLREEYARAMRHVERRLVGLESSRSGSGEPSSTGQEPDPAEQGYVRPREYPQLVTEEAEPDEERVYGDATPVVVQWRTARDKWRALLKSGPALATAEAKMQMLKLEIAIIEEHELTLPPASYPWGREDRRDQARRRMGALDEAEDDRRRALFRRWVRRILTCWLWRN